MASIVTFPENFVKKKIERKLGTAGLLKNLNPNYAAIYKLLIEKGYFSPKLVKVL